MKMGGESEPLRAEFDYAKLKFYFLGRIRARKNELRLNKAECCSELIVKSGMTLSAMSADIFCPARKLITRKINRTFWGRIEELPRGI